MIDILLATYNGEAYLQEQLDSLVAQSCRDWHLYVRDDGSTDRTVEIIRCFYEQHQSRVTILDTPPGNLGVVRNFEELRSVSRGDYVMFCDQDDVWLPEKVEKMLAVMQQAESELGRESPLLVHSDLCVVDYRLQTISPSMWDYQYLGRQSQRPLRKFLIQNSVTGCAMMINRSLCSKVVLPEQALMHDWYLAIAAAAMGKIVEIAEPLVQYRQHSSNVSGGVRYSLSGLCRKNVRGARKMLRGTCLQAGIFLDRHRDELSPEVVELLAEYEQLQHDSFFRKRMRIIHNGFWKSGFWRNVGLLVIA